MLKNKIVNDKKYLKRNIKSYNKNKFISIFMKKPIFYSYILFIGIFVFLDYSLYTEVFHFTVASFIENYLFKIDIFNSGFLLIFIVIPVAIIIAIYIMIYMVTFYINSYRKENIKYSNTIYYFIPMFVLLFYANTLIYFLSSSSKVINFFNQINFSIVTYSSIIWIFLIVVFVLLVLKYYVEYILKYFLLTKLEQIFVISLLLLLYYYLMLNISVPNDLFSFYPITFFIIFMGNYISYINYEINKKVKISKKEILLFKIMLGFFSIFLFNWLNNEILWNSTTKASYNLILNNGYKSQNYHNIKVRVIGYENNDANISECKLFDKNDYLYIKADTNTTYIPFFQNQKIYFVSKKKITCIYSVKKENASFILNDIGYLNEK